MKGWNQHNACRLGILGVEPEHVYGEGDFVGDALAGRLPLIPEFQVFITVICALAVFVVDIFNWKKWPAKLLFHEISVLKHLDFLSGRAQVSRDGNPNVTTLNVKTLFAFIKQFWCALRSKFRTTGGAAKFLLLVNSPAWTALNRHWFAALNAAYLPFFVGKHPTFAATLSRAIQRVATMPFAITAKLTRAAYEFTTTHFANKGDPIHPLRTSVVSVVASGSAEFSQLASIARDGNFLSAVQAGFHDLISTVSEYIYQVHVQASIAEGNF